MNYEVEILELKKRIEQLEKLVLGQNNETIKKENVSINSNRDKTKYMFEGKIYPKNRLVLAIITNYVKKENPTYEMLNQVFDKSLQGSLKVVETLQNANNISDGTKRYFMKEQDVLHLADGVKAVVCTQWGIFNIVRFVKLAQNLGYQIEII